MAPTIRPTFRVRQVLEGVREQLELLGLDDGAAWVGARAFFTVPEGWTRYRTEEGHLYYLRDDDHSISQWEHPF